jgi:osmoprotectant transport system permease protein
VEPGEGSEGVNVIDWFTNSTNWSGTPGVTPSLWQLLGQHILYTVLAVAIGAVIAVPLGAFIGHSGKGGLVVAGIANGLRGLPELGLLTLFVILMGLGVVPVVLALVILAIPPLLANTYAGVANVDRSIVDAARGVGMREGAVLLRVELPNALPLILGGLRTAMLQVVATATNAAYVGSGSLGYYIFSGLSVRDYTEMLAGVVLIAALALIVLGIMTLVQRFAISPGLRPAARRRRAAPARPPATSAPGVETAGGNPG